MKIIYSLLCLLAVSAWAVDMKMPANKEVKKQSVNAAEKTDADLKLLTKKLKNVQNEKGPIVFKTGSAELDAAKCENTMKTIADIIKAFPGFLIQIDGHTDSVGKPEANTALSQKRSESVKAYLQSKYSVEANRLTGKGWGSSQPIADNKTKDGQAKNRRVDFTVTRMK